MPTPLTPEQQAALDAFETAANTATADQAAIAPLKATADKATADYAAAVPAAQASMAAALAAGQVFITLMVGAPPPPPQASGSSGPPFTRFGPKKPS